MMKRNNTRLMALSARTGRISYVLLIDGKVKDWCSSRVGARSAENARIILRKWLRLYAPNVIVSENPDTAKRKGGRQVDILQTFMSMADDCPTLNMVVERQRLHKNVYDEAEHLGQLFPEIANKVPKRSPIWKPEPRALSYFEALALVQSTIHQVTPPKY